MNYYIQGDAANADQIREAFKEKGFDADWCPITRELLYFTANERVHLTDSDSIYADIIKTHQDYKELELPIEPCFKAGDKIEATIYGIKRRVTIRKVDKTNLCYFGTLEECIGFTEQDQWHLVPKPHYDISNFHAGMPVLVRNIDNDDWDYVVFSHLNRYSLFKFRACGDGHKQCIPFNEETKHLLGTTDMCDEQYINW